ncbi:MgtC/SapB family protein [uncultured Robinsoniella sp.]|uniref:MgtC/SapB family protein n=1 Tax=uncultured Robinsoniella sp. TaxID=904190 RepID=UPI00374E7BB4
MKAYLQIQSAYLLRMLGAALCGAAIGYERENHLKVAGIRTHIIVSLTSALMMIISKYGFYDVLVNDHINLDPSRIAAGIVTAIGFLGASVIFTRKMNVSGLTTAAGIWAVVGIGMAFGAGMYVIGIAATLFILVMQFVFHRNLKFRKAPKTEQITIQVEEDKDINGILDTAFTLKKIIISNIKATRIDNHRLEIKLYVRFPESYDINDVVTLLKDTPEIISIDI